MKCPSTHKKHKESVHVDKSVKQFICDQCPFATHAQLYLNVHKRKDHVNKRQKEFLCDNCPKEFDLKGKVSIIGVVALWGRWQGYSHRSGDIVQYSIVKDCSVDLSRD